MQKIIFFSIIIVTLFFTACQKKDDTQPDPQKVVINLSSPTDALTLHTGDTLHIDADISYLSELHGYEIELTDTATGNTLFTDDEHVHSDHFSIHETWPDTLTTSTRLLLKITVEIDHDGNEATKSVYINNNL